MSEQTSESSRWPCSPLNPLYCIYCFEPDPVALRALRLNLAPFPSATVLDIALGTHEAEVTFFSSPTDADSSLVEPERHGDPIRVTMRPLDAVRRDLGIDGVWLLKMDAEGAELEVLRGSPLTLAATTHVAMDAGAERQGQRTDKQVTEQLSRAGFMCHINAEVDSVVLATRPREE